jgi:hypothetical protein
MTAAASSAEAGRLTAEVDRLTDTVARLEKAIADMTAMIGKTHDIAATVWCEMGLQPRSASPGTRQPPAGKPAGPRDGRPRHLHLAGSAP